MWSLCNERTHKARKDYQCDAMHWIIELDIEEIGIEPEELAAIQKAKDEKCRILRGQTYVKVTGIFDGEWSVFRARPEIDDICKKYKVYDYY